MATRRSRGATAFVTRGDLEATIAPLATKDDLRATNGVVQSTRDDVRALGVKIESLESSSRGLADGVVQGRLGIRS